MSLRQFLIACLLLALAGCSNESAAPDVDKLLDEKFSHYNEGDQPGVAVMLVRDGEVRVQKSYGLANVATRSLITADTAFRLASVSKQFAAMAILILQEDGALSLDDPVSKYVPELAPYGGVTIRQLLVHTGGLPDYYDNIDTSAGMPTNHDAAVLLGKMASPEFAPGDRYAYSNAGYDMLGPVVEAAASMPFAQFVQERIFDVLGMHGSLVHDHTLPQVANRAIGYDVVADVVELNDADPLNGIVGSGGVYSTLNDLYRWDQALDGERLVSRESLALMFSTGATNSGEQLNYGLGWNLNEFAGHARQDHTGSWVGFRAYIGRIPKLHATIVMLANRGDIDLRTHAEEIMSAWLQLETPPGRIPAAT